MKMIILRQILILTAVLLALNTSQAYSQWYEEGSPVCTALNDQNDVSVVRDDAGGAIICWKDLRNGTWNLYIQRISGDGYMCWAPGGIPLFASGSNQYDHVMVTDHAGGAFIAWMENRTGNYDIYVQRIDSLGNVLGPIGGLKISDSEYRDDSPKMIPDGYGGIIVAYSEVRPDPHNEYLIDIYLYTQRIDDDFYVRWPYAGGSMPVVRSDGERHTPAIATDGSGGAFFAYREYINEKVYVTRHGSDGMAQWPPFLMYSDAGWPQITSDYSGGAVVTCPSGTDILATRIDGSGAFSWVEVNLDIGAVLPSYENDIAHLTERLGEGDFISVWQDGRNPDIDIYAQKFDSSGAIIWDAGAVPVVVKEGDQRIQALMSDGSDGAVVLWKDNGVYAQRIDASGIPMWNIEGILISSTTVDDVASTYVDTTSFIAGWSDTRGVDEDIYASRTDNSSEVIVATLLQSSCYEVSNSRIIIRWVLSEIPGDFEIYIQKKMIGNERSEYMIAPEVSQDGFSFTYIDENVCPGESYIYRIEYCDDEKRIELFTTDAISIPSAELALFQNFPNPFNPLTTITYYVPGKCRLNLEIFDVSGKRIVTLVDESQEKGRYEIEWNGQDQDGNPVSSGTYFYRLKAGKETISRKMVLLR